MALHSGLMHSQFGINAWTCVPRGPACVCSRKLHLFAPGPRPWGPWLITAAQSDAGGKQLIPGVPGGKLPEQQQQQQQQQAGEVPKQQQQQPPLQQQQQQQQQLQQQQQQQQQQQAAAASKGRRQQQVGWLATLFRGLRQTPSTLAAFIVGGFGICVLLFAWAKGTPLRRNHPYSFTVTFAEASKVDVGTPVRMKGVQIGTVAAVALTHSRVEAVAQVLDCSNIIPLNSRVDINLLGLAADPWIDITPPIGATVRKDHGPHHPDCHNDGLIVCNNGCITGSQGGSTDFMMKFFLSQHDRTRVKSTDTMYHTRQQA